MLIEPKIRIKSSSLENGLKVYRLFRELYNSYLRLDIRYGALYQSKPELAHLLEHMLFKPEEKILKEIKRLAGTIDAHVSDSLTTITISCPKSEFCSCLKLLASIILNRGESWSEEMLEHEKRILLEEISEEFEDPERRHEAEFFSLLISPKYPLGMKLEELRSSVESIELEEVISEAERLAPQASTLLVTESLEECGEGLEFLKRWGGSPTTKPSVTPSPKYGWHRGEKLGGLTYISIGWLAPNIYSEDNLILRLLPAYLTDPDVGVLYQKLRYEKGLIYDVYSRYVSLPAFGYFLIATSTTRREAAEEIADIIIREIESIAQGSLNEETLDIVRKRALFGLYELLDNVWDTLEVLSTNAAFYGDPLYSIRRGIRLLNSLSAEAFSAAVARSLAVDKFVLLIS